MESSSDAVEDNVRASGVVYRRERRTGWLKEAAGIAVVCAVGENTAGMRGAGNVRGTIDTDRYGEIVCGYLAEKPITRRLRVVFSPLSRQDGSQPRWRLRISTRFTRRVKKKESHASDLETAFNEALRGPSSCWQRPRCVIFHAPRFDTIETYCASDRIDFVALQTYLDVCFFMHHENIPGGGFAVNEITVWIFSENKDAPRIFSDVFLVWRWEYFAATFWKIYVLRRKTCSRDSVENMTRSQCWHGNDEIFNTSSHSEDYFRIRKIKKLCNLNKRHSNNWFAYFCERIYA